MSNILIFLIYVRSFYHITQRKLHYFEKITFSCRVLKTMVGAFGTTCTVTYYDCVENVCFLIFLCYLDRLLSLCGINFCLKPSCSPKRALIFFVIPPNRRRTVIKMHLKNARKHFFIQLSSRAACELRKNYLLLD